MAEACELQINQIAQNILHLLADKWFYSLEIEGENVFLCSLFLRETYFSFEIYLRYQARLITKHLGGVGVPKCELASVTVSASLHYVLNFPQKYFD